MKKHLVFFLILAVILSMAQLPTFASSYNDVPDDAWYSYVVNIMSDEGVMVGDKGGFHPKSQLTRAQAAQIVVNLNHQYKTDLEMDEDYSVTSNLYKTEHKFSFDKKLTKHWSADSVNLVINQMWKKGYAFDSYDLSKFPFSFILAKKIEPSTEPINDAENIEGVEIADEDTPYCEQKGIVIDFEPEKAITRSEFAAMIYYGFICEDESSDNSGTNLTALEAMVELGILQGYPNGEYYPNKSITRAEAAAICIRSRDVAAEWYIDAYC